MFYDQINVNDCCEIVKSEYCISL